MDYLIKRKIIKLNKQGNYGDQLVVTGKFGSGTKKQRYVNDHVNNYFVISKLLDILKDKVTQDQLSEILKFTIKEQIEKLTELKKKLCTSC